ncbi:MAG: putative DNA binding domain-containing protein [Bacillota bacterium]|nr:putative DNA binding domain-containing protein [Bacillota bacterium]
MDYSDELKTMEYKQEYSKTILKTICAFANFHDGIIVIGIKDNNDIVGVQKIDELKLNIENAINDAILPNPYYEFDIDTIEDAKILLVKVHKGDHTPYTYKGKSYIRRDTSTVQTDTITHQNLLLAGRNLGYEDLPVPFETLSFSYFESLLKKEYQISSLSEDLLRTLGLLKNNEYNNAAALVSDENPIDNAVVQLAAFSDKGVGRIKDRNTLASISILKQYDECMSFYKKHINVGEIIEGAYRKTVEDVPYIAYREAVANMIVHRDYSVSVDARIEFFSDRIEIVSPGGLPLGMLVEEYMEGMLSKPRNKTLTDIFLRLKIIERLATGVRRIKEQYIHQEIKPIFKVSENAVIVILPYVKESSAPVNEAVRENAITLTGKELIIYNLIRKQPSIKRAEIQNHINLEKSQTIELLNILRNAGWIIKVGNGPATGYQVLK